MSDSTRFFGDNGVVKVKSGTPAPDGDYYGIIVTAEITVTTAVFHPTYDAAAAMLDAEVLPPGAYPFRLKNLVVSAGTAYAYKN